MESPVVVGNPKKFGFEQDSNTKGGFRGEESPPERSGDAWEQLAARHPELAGLRHAAEPGAWTARKRRGSAAGHDRPNAEFSQDPRSGYFRDFFFDDIPPEFREHIPTRWNSHFEPQPGFEERTSRSPPTREQHPHPQQHRVPIPEEGPAPSNPTHVSTATQTVIPDEGPSGDSRPTNLQQHGLRNTVDLGQKTAAEPGQLDGESARNQRSMSAPPEGRFPPQQHRQMGNVMASEPPPSAAPNPAPPQQQQETHNNNKQPNVRHIPIFVEGRDQPVVNMNPTTTNNSTSTPPSAPEPRQAPPPQDDEDFFQPYYSKAFGSRFPGRTGASPFSTHKGFQQPRQNEQAPPQRQQQQHQPPQEEVQRSPPSAEPKQPPPPQFSPNDPIFKIQSIQKDVLDLMSKVEVFSGKSKKDREYIYLDEMLTRNLLKLDDIETEGKENIRLARKEAIKCIQKCINVLEAKAESSACAQLTSPPEFPAITSESEVPPQQNVTVNGESVETQTQTNETSTGVDNTETNLKGKSNQKKRDKSKEANKSACDLQNMDVDKNEGQIVASASATGMQVDEKVASVVKDTSTSAMEVDSAAPSQ